MPASAQVAGGVRFDLHGQMLEQQLARAQGEGALTLVAQAADQFKLWTHEDAPLDVMRGAVGV